MPGLMFDLGPVRSFGMGFAATDWPVILAFAQVRGLDDDDTDVLAAMCKGYCSALQAGEQPLSIAPVDQEG